MFVSPVHKPADCGPRTPTPFKRALAEISKRRGRIQLNFGQVSRAVFVREHPCSQNDAPHQVAQDLSEIIQKDSRKEQLDFNTTPVNAPGHQCSRTHHLQSKCIPSTSCGGGVDGHVAHNGSFSPTPSTVGESITMPAAVERLARQEFVINENQYVPTNEPEKVRVRTSVHAHNGCGCSCHRRGYASRAAVQHRN
jgi:hypothetical protein